MPLLSPADRRFAEVISDLTHCNPFLPERIEFERRALGEHFVARGADWNVHPERRDDHPNVVRIAARAEDVLDRVQASRRAGSDASGSQGGLAPEEREAYEDLCLYVLYYRHRFDFDDWIARGTWKNAARSPVRAYGAFAADAARLLRSPGSPPPEDKVVAHFFALCFQVRRAFHHIFSYIVGMSRPAARFRGAVWQSIFTHDIRRYRRVLFDRMTDFATLITGPSGTGKELAARAIGLSRYVPFDPKRNVFAEDIESSFYAINLAALSPTLIESELFGHRRGAFTGALSDRSGWLELCPPLGTVFLDEIGDLDPAIQLKLLRVFTTRTFQRIGDTRDRRFQGKIVAATNRNLADQRQAGRLRDDFFYRLCSDMITAPSLSERLTDDPRELRHLVRFIARRLVGDEADGLTREVLHFIQQRLGRGHGWPGNVRELEQCVRNVLIRKEYQPMRAGATDAEEEFLRQVRDGTLTATEVMRQYCARVYANSGTFQEAARRLGLDRRTVKSQLKPGSESDVPATSAVPKRAK